jgi:hypothetical protein
MAFPSVVTSAAFNNNTSNTSWTPLSNYACQTGELIVFLSARNNTTQFTASSGWTQLAVTTSSVSITHQVFYTYATSNAVSLTLTGTPFSTTCSGICFRISDGFTLSSAASSNPFSSAANPPLLNTGKTKDYLWIATRAVVSTSDATVAPTGYSGLINSAGSSVRTSAAWKQANAASDDPSTFTAANATWASFTIAVSPPPVPAIGDKRYSVWL